MQESSTDLEDGGLCTKIWQSGTSVVAMCWCLNTSTFLFAAGRICSGEDFEIPEIYAPCKAIFVSGNLITRKS